MARHGAFPPEHSFRLEDTHRLIPSKHSDSGTVLSRLLEDEAELSELMELDGATNDRLLGEEGLLPGIGVHELVYGVRYAHIVNAAFTHPSPTGSRFNGSDRGAWYAATDRNTSATEVAFHKLQQLEEVNWEREERGTFDDYLADFAMDIHDLRGSNPQYRKYLKAFPIPECYADSQKLAAELLARQSNGILYPSVRRKGGTCLVCFRPALVYNVRHAARLEFRLLARRPFTREQMREVKMN